MIQENGIKLLADGGYSMRMCLITPDDMKSDNWNQEQKKERSIVEIVFSYIHNWKSADITFKQSPEFQAITLMTIYNIEAFKLEKIPIRV